MPELDPLAAQRIESLRAEIARQTEILTFQLKTMFGMVPVVAGGFAGAFGAVVSGIGPPEIVAAHREALLVTLNQLLFGVALFSAALASGLTVQSAYVAHIEERLGALLGTRDVCWESFAVPKLLHRRATFMKLMAMFVLLLAAGFFVVGWVTWTATGHTWLLVLDGAEFAVLGAAMAWEQGPGRRAYERLLREHTAAG